MFTNRLVLVEWEDSKQPIAAWQFLREIEGGKTCCCISVGYLVSEENGVKVLAPNLADISNEDDTQVSGLITIPDSCIKRVADLNESATHTRTN